jgi:hypothetical protein
VGFFRSEGLPTTRQGVQSSQSAGGDDVLVVGGLTACDMILVEMHTKVYGRSGSQQSWCRVMQGLASAVLERRRGGRKVPEGRRAPLSFSIIVFTG